MMETREPAIRDNSGKAWTRAELLARLERLKKDVVGMQNMLSRSRYYDTRGNLLTRDDYEKQRGRYIAKLTDYGSALRETKRLYHELGEEIRRRQRTDPLEFRGGEVDPANPLSLLAACHAILVRMHEEDVPFTKEEWTVVSRVREWFNHNSPERLERSGASNRTALDNERARM